MKKMPKDPYNKLVYIKAKLGVYVNNEDIDYLATCSEEQKYQFFQERLDIFVKDGDMIIGEIPPKD